MERIKDMPANTQTVAQLIVLAEETPVDRLVPKLREYVREHLDEGYPSEQLYVDMMRVYDRVSRRGNEAREDAILDVMDFLTGWCSTSARLY